MPIKIQLYDQGLNGAALDIIESLVIVLRSLNILVFKILIIGEINKNTQQLDLKSSHFDKSVIPRDALKFIGNEIGRAIN